MQLQDILQLRLNFPIFSKTLEFVAVHNQLDLLSLTCKHGKLDGSFIQKAKGVNMHWTYSFWHLKWAVKSWNQFLIPPLSQSLPYMRDNLFYFCISNKTFIIQISYKGQPWDESNLFALVIHPSYAYLLAYTSFVAPHSVSVLQLIKENISACHHRIYCFNCRSKSRPLMVGERFLLHMMPSKESS